MLFDFWHYYGTAQGRRVRRLVRETLRRRVPTVQGQIIVAAGYATPYLRPYYADAAMVVHITPPHGQPIFWPPEGGNIISIAEDGLWPLQDASVDHILLVHALEHAPVPAMLLAECWRVLAGQGRLMIIAPNRLGLWARDDATPFGHGHPFTLMQIKNLLRSQNFTFQHAVPTLFMPPASSRLLGGLWWRMARLIEILGAAFMPVLAGVWVIQAQKEVYAVTPLKHSVLQKIGLRRLVSLPLE